MSTMSSDRSQRMRPYLRGVSALISLVANTAASAPIEETLADRLASEPFVRGCVGDDGGEIVVYVESTYLHESSPLQRRLSAALHQWSTPGPVHLRSFDAGETETSCDNLPAPWPTPHDARVTMHLTLARGADDQFAAVDAVIQRRGVCRQIRLHRDEWSDYCAAARPLEPLELVRPASSPFSQPAPTPAHKPDGSTLLTVGIVLSAMGQPASIAATVLTWEGRDDAHHTLIPSAAYNLVALGVLAQGVALRGHFNARRDQARGVVRRPDKVLAAGAALLVVGVTAEVLALVEVSTTIEPRYMVIPLAALSQAPVVAGATLLAYGIGYRQGLRRSPRKRWAVAPRLAPGQLGLALTGRF